MAPVNIDLSGDLPPFNPAAYIGKNKKSPPTSDVLPEAHAALADVLKLPASQAALFPDREMSITEFLALTLPRESASFVFTKPDIWFSDEELTGQCSADRVFIRGSLRARFQIRPSRSPHLRRRGVGKQYRT